MYNPISGVTLTFLKTSTDTHGSLLQLDVTVNPGGRQSTPFVHRHPRQQKAFKIRSGKIKLTLKGEKYIYEAGETVLILPGTPHTWENASNQEELNFICELTPALHSEKILETLWSLSQTGKLAKNASAPLLQLALTLSKYPNHVLLDGSPAWLQKILFRILSPLALVLGYTAELEYKNALAAK